MSAQPAPAAAIAALRRTAEKLRRRYPSDSAIGAICAALEALADDLERRPAR